VKQKIGFVSRETYSKETEDIMTIKEAKSMKEDKWITNFSLVKNHGWSIEVSNLNGFKAYITAARGEIRMFKKIDSAIKTAESIGFIVNELRSVRR
jgi:thiamine biosynthesis lipoprotein ApbE